MLLLLIPRCCCGFTVCSYSLQALSSRKRQNKSYCRIASSLGFKVIPVPRRSNVVTATTAAGHVQTTSSPSQVSPLLLLRLSSLQRPDSETDIIANANDGNNNDNDDEPRINFLLPDLVAIVVACQLVGLLHVINDPFWLQNGGWLQPMPAIPATLTSLVTRISINSLAWILADKVLVVGTGAGISVGGLTNKKDSPMTSSSHSSSASHLSKIVPVSLLLVFCAVRVLITVAVAASVNIPWTDILLECYVISLAVAASRYLVAKLNIY